MDYSNIKICDEYLMLLIGNSKLFKSSKNSNWINNPISHIYERWGKGIKWEKGLIKRKLWMVENDLNLMEWRKRWMQSWVWSLVCWTIKWIPWKLLLTPTHPNDSQILCLCLFCTLREICVLVQLYSVYVNKFWNL